MIRKIVKYNNFEINKYSPVSNSIETKNSDIDEKYTYLKRSYIFNYLWMDSELSEIEKNLIYVNYPKVFNLKNVLWNYLIQRASYCFIYLLRNI